MLPITYTYVHFHPFLEAKNACHCRKIASQYDFQKRAPRKRCTQELRMSGTARQPMNHPLPSFLNQQRGCKPISTSLAHTSSCFLCKLFLCLISWLANTVFLPFLSVSHEFQLLASFFPPGGLSSRGMYLSGRGI